MSNNVDPRRATIFKRFETDEEFVERMREVFKERKIDDFGSLRYKKDKDLDEYVWDAVKLQRRIIDDVSATNTKEPK